MGQRSIRQVAGSLAACLVAASTTAVTVTAAAAEPPGDEVRLEASTTRPVAERAADWTAFPVPTSAAGLAEIRTAPNGDMWFVMEEANQVGRITPAGVITEFALPPHHRWRGEGARPDGRGRRDSLGDP